MCLSNWFVLSLMLLSAPLPAQENAGTREREDEFATAKPAIGEPLPKLTVCSLDGKEFKTSDLKANFCCHIGSR